VKRRWLLIVFGPALVLLLGSAAALVALPHPIPKNATPVQRLYLSHCAECHGANGHGSWRATLFMIRPGDLTRPGRLAKPDDYLVAVIEKGGAPFGKPGMPAFGFHLSDEQVRELIRYIRALPGPAAR
jgi:mono/diheme cytochrome c family protein